MRTVEIITHCWAEKRPEFAKLFTAQLSSLLLWPPKSRITISACICAAPEIDEAAMSTAALFDKRFQSLGNVRLQIYAGKLEQVLRRAVMRNMAAKLSKADRIIFADCDYIYADGCLDALANAELPAGTKLILPRSAFIHRSHAAGDRELARIKPGELFTPDLSLFKPWKPKMAIGGLQIVPGDVARKGYLPNTKWTRPVPTATDFLNTREDRAYRLSIGGKAQIVDMPGLYRCRHSASAFEDSAKRLAQTKDA